MEQFSSGWKRNYYGKGDVVVYRLDRRGNTIFGANVKMLVYGDAFWPTYTTGDNTGLIATDSMKNFIQRESLAFEGADLASLCRDLATKFLATYPQVDGAQLSAESIPYTNIGGPAFAPTGPDRATARVELNRDGIVEIASGIRGFKLLRLGGSAFHGFVRDQYTTLPDIQNRPLHMWLDLEWTCTAAAHAFDNAAPRVRRIVHEIFEAFESGSIQQVIYQLGTCILEREPHIAEIHLEAQNRTWDTVADHNESLGIYTDPRPPYGCLGLRLRR